MDFLDDIAKFLETVGNGEYVLRSIRQAPEHISQSPNVVVGKWFADRGLPEFAEPVLAAGYYKLEDLANATASDWDSIGVTNPNMRQLLVGSLRQSNSHVDPKKNPFVCIGRNVPCERDKDKTFTGGSVRWLVGSWKEPTIAPDIVSLHVLMKTLGTSRTKCILEAIAAFEDEEEHCCHPEAKTESEMMSPMFTMRRSSFRLDELDFEMESRLSKGCTVEESSDSISQKAEDHTVTDDTESLRKESSPYEPASLNESAALHLAGRKKASSLSSTCPEKKNNIDEQDDFTLMEKEPPVSIVVESSLSAPNIPLDVIDKRSDSAPAD